MQMKAWRNSCRAALFIAGFATASAYRGNFRRAVVAARIAGGDERMSSSGLEAAASSMIKQMLEGRLTLRGVANTLHSRMDFAEAVKRLDGKLPAEVESLVAMTGKANTSKTDLDEDSMQKARGILNDMMFKAWGELDAVIIECKEFQNRNRDTYNQVVIDLARLGQQLGEQNRIRTEAGQGVERMKGERLQVSGELEVLTSNYQMTRSTNDAELTIRKNDLAVFEWILTQTKCADMPSLLQLRKGNKTLVQPEMSVCQTSGGLELNFGDHKLQKKLERMMTPAARAAIQMALSRLEPRASLLQTGRKRAVQPTLPVDEDPHSDGQWKKCSQGTPNCGLLYDTMSLEWGKFRDSVDELTAEMSRNHDSYTTESGDLNDQLMMIGDEKGKFMEELAAAISEINTDTEVSNQKEDQRQELQEEFDKRCAEFRAAISEILYTKICAVRKVRNELLENSAETPPTEISDCDFTDWRSTYGQCFRMGVEITCDDSCPQPDPYACGGWEDLRRDVVVTPNAAGMPCPVLTTRMKCGQKKCPVDCVMSQWSAWSKCTRECEGGIEVRTRSILTKANHGGKWCDAVEDERECNTGTCDRNCALSEWSEWAPCSMACDGGMTSRRTKVLIPTRGRGLCPGESSTARLQEEECNTQACNGDEICIAKQDLIIALDSSGSLRSTGFEILRNFSANLTGRYKPVFFGEPAVRMGAVVFGNGVLTTEPDGTIGISSALQVSNLTDDIESVRSALESQVWQKGFTNMAQGLALADKLLNLGGRPEAQSAVIILSDGKYSFKYQTAEKARELKDKNIQLFMAPVADFADKQLEDLKDWASQPWETNYEQIPGLDALQYNLGMFAMRLMIKFCPDSMSPSLMESKDLARSYMMLHEDGYPNDACGAWIWVGFVSSLDACAQAARNVGYLAFSFGHSYSAGGCYSEAVHVTQDNWDEWLTDRTSPPCPGGQWLFNPYFDTYVINPATAESTVQ